MALTPCHECRKEISDKAKACPHCGATPKQKTSALTWAILALIVIGIAKTATTDTPTPTPKTAQEIAAENAADLRRATARTMAKAIKATMRDPDSLVFETMLINQDATVACVEYRARNGFGGMNREIAVHAKGATSNKPQAWNAHCTKAGMFNLLPIAKSTEK